MVILFRLDFWRGGSYSAANGRPTGRGHEASWVVNYATVRDNLPATYYFYIILQTGDPTTGWINPQGVYYRSQGFRIRCATDKSPTTCASKGSELNTSSLSIFLI